MLRWHSSARRCWPLQWSPRPPESTSAPLLAQVGRGAVAYEVPFQAQCEALTALIIFLVAFVLPVAVAAVWDRQEYEEWLESGGQAPLRRAWSPRRGARQGADQGGGQGKLCAEGALRVGAFSLLGAGLALAAWDAFLALYLYQANKTAA